MALAWRPTLVASLLPALASGHGFLTKPEMRGGAKNNEGNGFCPQCLGSTDLPMDTCGNANFLNVVEPVTELRAGEMAELEVKVTAHHKGHFVFRLCDQALSSQTGGFQKEEECLNKHVLKRARPEEVHDDCQVDDQRGDCQPYDEANPGHWYLPPPTWPMTYRFHYWIPSNLTCERCTLQWWWMSANSCTPHEDAYICFFQEMERQGWNVDEWCPRVGTCSFSGTCPEVQRGPSLCGEQFKNCADVRIVDDGSTRGPTPAPAPTPPTPPAAPAPTRAPTVGGVCVHETSCNKSDWCNNANYTDWCPLHTTSECPSPQCFVSGAQPSPSPSPKPSPSPSPGSTSEPEPEPEPEIVGGEKQLVAFVENWKACPSVGKIKGYDMVIVSFAVTYTYDPVKNQCDQTCTISTPATCGNTARPDLIREWREAGTTVLISFGGAGMGGSWDGDVNDCWLNCFSRADSVVSQLATIVEGQGYDGVDIDYEYLHSDQSDQFLKDLTTGLRSALPAGKIISHAPMDGDIAAGQRYYRVLQEVAASVDYLLPQYYNGPNRPASDLVGTLDHMADLVNGIFSGDASKVLVGFCIADCSFTGSNVNGAQAVTVLEGIANEFPGYGGAFLWAASDDLGWSGPVKELLDSQATTAEPTASPTMEPGTAAPTESPTPAATTESTISTSTTTITTTSTMTSTISSAPTSTSASTRSTTTTGTTTTTTTPAPRSTSTSNAAPAPTPAPAGGGACTGEQCPDSAHCRSKWGHCGSGAPWCNDESTWKAGGCGPSPGKPQLVQARRSQGRQHTFLGLLQTASPLSRTSADGEL